MGFWIVRHGVRPVDCVYNLGLLNPAV
jgi:hypothetical protein